MKRLIVLMAAFMGLASISWGQQMQNLPNDPETKVGKLENGLTYYIRHNENPAQRAEFYLATNVGAIQEAPDQDGLAHFLEHMCFNGTKNFPGKGILNYLESIGASFGGNVNASTGVEQTTYMLTNIPLVSPGVVDSCLLIIHDYSHFVTCDPAEIDAERGVILEEKRSRNTAAWRMHMAGNAVIYAGTPYASCSLIGSEEQLKTFRPESLTNFYQTWYRPDNQAVIVVGDIDVDEVETKIKSIFADIPAPVNPKAKEVITIPGNEEPVVAVLTDPENTSSTIQVLWKSERAPEEINSTVAKFASDIIEYILSLGMAERFTDIAAQPDAPFLSADLGMGKLCETMEVALASANSKDEAIAPAFAALMYEMEKLRRFGLTDGEIERAKANILASMESSANAASTRRNSQFISPLLNNFFDNEAFMDPAVELQLAQMLLPQITTDAINPMIPELLTRENMVVIVNAPRRDGLVLPSEDELRQVLTAIQNVEIANVAAEELPSELLDSSKLKGAKVKKSAKGLYGSDEFMLANGLKVVLYPTEIEKDRIIFDVYSKGGQSLISDQDLLSFESNIWGLFVNNSGLSQFASGTLSKMLSGKNVSVSPYLNSYTHGIQGFSTPKDLETAIQCAYLYYVDPRFDPEEYGQGIAQINAVLPNLMDQSNYKLQKELYKTIYDSDRNILISDDVVAKASLGTIERVYRQLFSSVNGATLVMAGDFDKDQALALIQKYFGSIKKSGKPTDWSYRNDGIINGRKVNEFRTKMAAPKVTVVQVWKHDAPYTIQAEANYDALSYILDMVYVRTLREEEGGTYGAQSSTSVSREPNAQRALQVAFETNEEQADRLRELAIKGLQDIAKNGPEADDFDKTVKNMEKNIPERERSASYWLSNLRTGQQFGFDFHNEYKNAVANLTPAGIQAAAQELLDSNNFLEVVMRPEL